MCKCTLAGLETSGVDEVIRGRPGHTGELGDYVIGDAEAQEVTYFILLAVESRDTERSPAPSELFAKDAPRNKLRLCWHDANGRVDTPRSR